MKKVRSFAPVADASARVLVVGSMPGAASLAAGQYYAHPRNQFWRIMSAVLGKEPGAGYEDHLRMLRSGGLALWDVLDSCVRPGSADTDIRPGSIKVNNFAAFLLSHPGIGYVFFNGAKSEECWRRRVLPLPETCSRLRYRRLPSTSPANASLPYVRKLSAWRAALASALK